MSKSDYTVEELKAMFESALPDNYTIEKFRKNVDFVYRGLSHKDGVCITPAESPKEAFDRLWVDATIKKVFHAAYPRKYEFNFYDLICLSIIMMNEEEDMLVNFLATEILQTTSDNRCQSISMYYLKKTVEKNTKKNEASLNFGVHPNLKDNIIGYKTLEAFLKRNQKQNAEVVINDIRFLNDKRITLEMRSVNEWMDFGTGCAVDISDGSVSVTLDKIDRLISDTYGWEELNCGYLQIMTLPENGIEFSYIHKYTNIPLIQIKCKEMKVEVGETLPF